MTMAIASPPVAIGPSWQRDGAGAFILPEHTLGWQQLGWTTEYLQHPDGPKADEPLQLTDEQARLLLWWYAIDSRGEFSYRTGMLRRLKGWGKDPWGSFVAALEFVGPCRFGGWASDGQPIAVSHPAAWIQTAAVSRDQTRNTMTLFPGLFSPKAIKEFGIDLGKEIIYAERGRRRIEAVTSSPRALEGGRPTFILKNETHHWVGPNEGHEMSKVIARNAAKLNSRVLAISNAHAPGENSDAEHDWEAWQKLSQRGDTGDMFYDSLEAAADTDIDSDESLMAGIPIGDSYWVPRERIIAEIRDPRTSPTIARRFYLNQIVAEEDKPFDRKRFEALTKPYYTVPDQSVITLGFDGSINRDHTALIGTEVATGYQWVAGYWEPVPNAAGEVQIPIGEVSETVDAIFKRWHVWRLEADPYKWGLLIDDWAGKYGEDRVVKFPASMLRRQATAVVAYRNAMQTGELSNDGDPRFVAAIANSHKHMREFRDDQGERLFTIQKERPDSPLKIDAAVAGYYSWDACKAAIASGATVAGEEVKIEWW